MPGLSKSVTAEIEVVLAEDCSLLVASVHTIGGETADEFQLEVLAPPKCREAETPGRSLNDKPRLWLNRRGTAARGRGSDEILR